MADLFLSLRTAARALDAQRYGLDVAGQNIANVNTPGYSRRTAELAEVPPSDPWSPGGGVDIVGVTAARAPLIEARLRFEQPASASDGAVADSLAVVEAGLGEPGASLDAALSRFYNTYGTLAQNPTSATARQQVIVEGQSLARAFNDMAGQFSLARRDADNGIRTAVLDANMLARQIADLNAAITEAGPRNSAGLVDQRAVAIASLNTLINVGVVQDSNGTVSVTIGSGRALVIGATTYDLAVSSAPPSGFATIAATSSSGTSDITSEITGGTVSGLLRVRDTLVPDYINQLDQMAFTVASDVNTLTGTGFDLAGNAGVDFFDQPAVVAGAAGLMSVSAAVAADGRLVVAAGTATAGDNQIANAMAALQDSPMTGGTARPVEAWASLVYSVAADSRAATLGRAAHQQITDQLRNLRDQISGVSIDEEAAMLLRFQRAYEANARFFQTASQTLDILMQLVRT